MTLEPCRLAVVEPEQFKRFLSTHSEAAYALIVALIRRASNLARVIGSLALLDVYGRVIHTLEGQQGPASSQAPIQLTQITHQQIASRVGASREMVSRLLKDLEKGGYVELGIKRITLKKKLPARW